MLQADGIHQLGEEIGVKLANSETMGAEGKVEESMRLLEEVEELKKRKAMAEVNTTQIILKKQYSPRCYATLVLSGAILSAFVI